MSGYETELPLHIGTRIRGTYTVEKRLGQGAFSVVYRVRHGYLGTQAMKVLLTASESAAAVASKVIEEALTLASLASPYVVRLFEANSLDHELGGHPFITMEYVHGGTLSSFLETRVRLHPTAALQTARQICLGLEVAHRNCPPIVHRDLTLRNILVSSVSPSGTPQVKVGDFGLACRLDVGSGMARPAGTLEYLAPEAAWGFYSPVSDVYSVGIILYRLLTGVYPHRLLPMPEHNDPLSHQEAILRSHQVCPLPPSAFCPGLSRDIDMIVERALDSQPFNRLKDATAFRLELDDILRRSL